jgi:hypothetical protein
VGDGGRTAHPRVHTLSIDYDRTAGEQKRQRFLQKMSLRDLHMPKSSSEVQVTIPSRKIEHVR